MPSVWVLAVSERGSGVVRALVGMLAPVHHETGKTDDVTVLRKVSLLEIGAIAGRRNDGHDGNADQTESQQLRFSMRRR